MFFSKNKEQEWLTSSSVVTATCISTEIGFRNLVVFLPMYWRSSSLKTRNDCFDIQKFSFHSSATTSLLRNWKHHCFVHPGRIQYSCFFLSHFFFSLEITLSYSVSFRTRCLSVFSSRYYLNVYVVWLELNSRNFVNLKSNNFFIREQATSHVREK